MIDLGEASVWSMLLYQNNFVQQSLLIEDIIDHQIYTHNLSSCEIKGWTRNSGLNGIQTRDLCDTGAVLSLPTELSSQLGAGHIVSS